MRRHLAARPPIDDQRLRAEASRGARRVDGGVAAAVDRDATADAQLVAGFHLLEELNRVVDSGHVGGGNLLAPAEVCADGEEHGIEAAVRHVLFQIDHPAIELDLDAQADDARDFRVENLARQPVFRDAEVHHPAGDRTRVEDRHRMPATRQLPGGGQSARSRADDEDPFPGRRGRWTGWPALFEREVADETFDGVDADGAVHDAAVAGILAGVVADAPVHGRKRIVAKDQLPRGTVAARLRFVQPGLHVLACRTGMIAG